MKKRVKIQVRGVVQGVGFRPHVFRVAQDFNLSGFVRNDSDGVYAELEGERVDDALAQILKTPPPAARVVEMSTVELPVQHDVFFEIRESVKTGGNTRISPDLASCDECLNEVFDPQNRRHLYPFTNCTNCGPRFSIIDSIPYDRPNTTMAHFTMCDACQIEYDDPKDRRYHAQPNACAECGPRVSVLDHKRRPLGDLNVAKAALMAGDILAVKGIGGFHLICDARNDEAVQRLRASKNRPDKPLAVMFRDLRAVRRVAEISDTEARLLSGVEAPIVLVEGQRGIAPSINRVGTRTGAFLAHTPLHHLLLTDLDAVVATSANPNAEPICTHVDELFDELDGVFDVVIDHDRIIARPLEDSVLEVFMGHTLFHRFGRGYAIGAVSYQKGPDALALGGHLKSALAVRVNHEILLGPQLGDLVGPKARLRFQEAVDDLPRLLNVHPQKIRCDKHPDYFSSRIGVEIAAEAVQHHEAHVAAVMAEHGLTEAFGVAWDGVGLGDDHTAWGGEFFVVRGAEFQRTSIRPYRVHPGDAPARQPWRSGHAVAAALGRRWTPPEHVGDLASGFAQNLQDHGVMTTSVGRLFDGFASLSGLCQLSTFEAHAAHLVQAAGERFVGNEDSPDLERGDWGGVMNWALDSEEIERAAYRLHAGLARLILTEALAVGEGLTVVLSGGCFQNRLLLRLAVDLLKSNNLDVRWPTRFPAGDGGLAVGQLARKFKDS